MEEQTLQKILSFTLGDPDLLGSRQASSGEGFKVGNGRCIFTVKALFESLSSELDMDYGRFRSELYRSTLNADLRVRGYKIEVHHTTGQVETSTYRLVKV